MRRQALRDEVVVGVARLHLDDLALLADVLDRCGSSSNSTPPRSPFGSGLNGRGGLRRSLRCLVFMRDW